MINILYTIKFDGVIFGSENVSTGSKQVGGKTREYKLQIIGISSQFSQRLR